ncbi:MAG TPA: M28 family peptidase [Phycisphaerales bacterium]|nr:M28 family peptidase [Phycisphaerales bacterium]
MTRSDPRSLLRAALLPVVLSAMILAACQSTAKDPARVKSAPVAPTTTVSTTPSAPTPAVQAKPAAPSKPEIRSAVSAALMAADDDTRFMVQQITTLSHPFFEGRSADTKGNRAAAALIQQHFDSLGLKPAFGADAAPPDAPAHGDHGYQQAFSVPGEMKVNLAEASFTSPSGEVKLESGKDFNPLGVSGTAKATGELVFVGYSITDGEEGYTNYGEKDDLAGKIALLYRFEPMDDAGHSKWAESTGGSAGRTTGNWSGHSGLTQKIGDAIKRNAAGVIVVNPPGADDPRATRLDTANRTRFGKQLGVPIVMLSNDAAEKLIKAADPEGRSPLDLRKVADAGLTSMMPLNKGGLTVTLNTDLERQQLATSNVGGVLEGKGGLASEWIIIGGHYDHVGYGYVGGARPGNIGQLHPGADDNASGAAGVMLIAKKLAERYKALPEGASARSVLLMTFSSEEMGLLGAEHYVKNSTIENSRVIGMLNMDMIGRLDKNALEIAGTGTADEWNGMLDTILADYTFDAKRTASGGNRSDHAAFYRAGTPVLHFFTGTHRDYHTPTDTFEKVNYEGAAKIVNLVTDIAMALSDRPQMLTYHKLQEQQQRSMAGMKVRLGIAPGNYNDSEPGVLVGDVTPNTSAAKAGIHVGDRIIKWGGEELANVGAMMERLAGHNPGDKVDLVVVREGQEVIITVTLLAREQQG